MAVDESKEEYKIRCMKGASEVENIAIQLAKKEGACPGKFDAEPFDLADKQGFFVGQIKNEIVSIISCIKYNENYSFLGFYIVVPKYRGKGYGMKIWKHSESHFGKCCELYSVAAQVKTYEKSGFHPLWQSDRFELDSSYLDNNNNNNENDGKHDGNNDNNLTIKQVRKDDLKEINEFDLLIFPAKREEFLKEWLIPSDKEKVGNSRMGYIARNKNDNKLQGFCCIRQCFDGAWRCGPLYCKNENVAKHLLIACLKHGKENTEVGLKLWIDVPLINENAIDLVTKTFKAKKLELFRLTRMYHGKKPTCADGKPLKNEFMFAISNVELG